MTRKVLKFAHEIERGDVLVINDQEYVIVTVNVDKDLKSVHLELYKDEEDPFDVRHMHYDLKDPFIIQRTI